MQSVPHGELPEVDHGNATSDLRAVGVLVGEHIERLTSLIHYADVVPQGRQWTIPFGLDCDFDGELVIRVRNAGGCERKPGGLFAGAPTGGR